MAIDFFGFSISKSKKQRIREEVSTPVAPVYEDGAAVVDAANAYGMFVDMDGISKNEFELITRYREISMIPEVDYAIDDITNESIAIDDPVHPITINLDKLELNSYVKNKIAEEFENVLDLLDWHINGYEIFRKWYVDGRLYYNVVIDDDNPRDGIIEVRYIDPRQIKLFREVEKNADENSGVELQKVADEYYIYTQQNVPYSGYTANDVGTQAAPASTSGVKFSKDAIIYINSGITDRFNSIVLGHLQKCIKPANQLKMMEDSLVIYRIARAPERRIFYIDVGNLPKSKADMYLRDIMQRYRNKLNYNVDTGEVSDDRRYLSMLEDYWLPRQGGKESSGTSIETLPGGQNLSEIEDVEYFQKKLYRALNIPFSRLEKEAGYQVARGNEILRDEIKFNRFVSRLRNRFSKLFTELLERQLILKGILTKNEWEDYKNYIVYNYSCDNNFAEAKETELIKSRIELLGQIEGYVGKYFSEKWVRDNVLRLNQMEVEAIAQDMKIESGEIEEEEGIELEDESGEIEEPMGEGGIGLEDESGEIEEEI